MIVLPDTWYFPVPVKAAQCEPYWLNKKYKNEIDTLKSNFREIVGSDNQLHDYDLGIVTQLNSSPFIYASEEWDEYLKSVFMFKADRFFYPYGPDMGSGRNVIFKNGCWKGVGRNHAATRIEHRHSSGLMGHTETLVEIFFDRLLDKMDSSVHVPVWGGFCYKDGHSSFLIRSADSVRCSQVPAFLKKAERDAFLNYIFIRHMESPSSTWMLSIMTRIAKLMSRGVFHISPTRDNITVDGRILDNYSMEWVEGSKNINFSCEIFSGEALNIEGNNHLSWKKILSSNVNALASPVNYLSAQYHAISEAFTTLGVLYPSWEELIPVLGKILSLPDVFFHFHSNALTNKVKYAHDIFSHAEEIGADIEVTQKEERHYLISVGKRKHRETSAIVSKLLTIASLDNKNKTSEKMIEVLWHVLKKNELCL